MNLPYLEKSYFCYNGVRLNLNHCYLKEFRAVIGDAEDRVLPGDNIVQLEINNDLGQILVTFGKSSRLLLEINLELLEEVSFLQYVSKYSLKNYAYFEFMGDDYVIFSCNLIARLRQSPGKIAGLIFLNSTCIKHCQLSQNEFFLQAEYALINSIVPADFIISGQLQ